MKMPFLARTSRRSVPVMLAAVLLAGVAACSSVPTTRFHTLMSTPSERVERLSTAPEPLLYELVSITVPPQVDMQQFVVRNADDSLFVLEQERWLAPLADEIRGAVAERLVARFNAVESRQPLPNQRPSQRVRIDVARFEAVPGQEVRLQASWTVRVFAEASDGGAHVSCRSDFRQSVGTGYNAIAAGQRQNAVKLADQIGAAMRSLQAGSASCP